MKRRQFVVMFVSHAADIFIGQWLMSVRFPEL